MLYNSTYETMYSIFSISQPPQIGVSGMWWDTRKVHDVYTIHTAVCQKAPDGLKQYLNSEKIKSVASVVVNLLFYQVDSQLVCKKLGKSLNSLG